jgi:hypothetical protein
MHPPPSEEMGLFRLDFRGWPEHCSSKAGILRAAGEPNGDRCTSLGSVSRLRFLAPPDRWPGSGRIVRISSRPKSFDSTAVFIPRAPGLGLTSGFGFELRNGAGTTTWESEIY